jgi:hypothetical protein
LIWLLWPESSVSTGCAVTQLFFCGVKVLSMSAAKSSSTTPAVPSKMMSMSGIDLRLIELVPPRHRVAVAVGDARAGACCDRVSARDQPVHLLEQRIVRHRHPAARSSSDRTSGPSDAPSSEDAAAERAEQRADAVAAAAQQVSCVS